MIWRLHIRPTPKNDKTHEDVVRYCLENNVAGMGWPVDGSPRTASEYETMAIRAYGRRPASIRFAHLSEEIQYVWIRDKTGNYYLGRLSGPWRYSSDPQHLELDIPNQRSCHWVDIGNEEHVPGKIVACFRQRLTFQRVNDDVIEAFSARTFSQKIGELTTERSLLSDPVNAEAFFRLISAEDCEDVVGLYLQKVLGYCIIPSTCKPSTIGYEFVLKHSETAKSAVVQVKQGKVNLDSRLKGRADHVFLFSTEGTVDAADDTVTVLSPDELLDFVNHNQALLPTKISYWL